MYELYDYQKAGVSGIRNAYMQGYKAPLYQLSTGGGKTVVFSHITQNAVSRGKRVLILVHRNELLKQAAASLEKCRLHVGRVSPKFSADYAAPVQVAMVQTIVNRLHKFVEGFDLIITDEAHHVVAGTYRKIVDFFDTFQLGVTATPIRTDGKGLGIESGGVYDKLILGPSTKELIARGFLVQPIMYGGDPLDLSKVSTTSGGDYSKKQLDQIMNNKYITGNAVDHYIELSKYEPAVAFCTSVRRAEETAAAFRAEGLKFYALSGKTDPDLRNRMLRGLGDGSIHGIASCDVISEGTDIPAIRTAIMLRPTNSLSLYIQQGGRALRTAPGKENAIILDHVGNHTRFGSLIADRDWSLDGKVKKIRKDNEEKAAAVHQCENCYAVHSANIRLCPFCNHYREIKENELVQIDGRLKRLSDLEMKIEKKREVQKRKKEIWECKTEAELVAYAAQNGYKRGWPKYILKSRAQRQAKKNN